MGITISIAIYEITTFHVTKNTIKCNATVCTYTSSISVFTKTFVSKLSNELLIIENVFIMYQVIYLQIDGIHF